MCGSVLSAALAAVAVYLGTKNKDLGNENKEQLIEIQARVDGQLTEVIALKRAVSFAQGEEKQRDKQDIKDAVMAGIKQANGEEAK
jgi:hypothetical protein